MKVMKAREYTSPLIEELLNETTPEEMEKISKQMVTKTPIQELLQLESELTYTFDSDIRVAGAILDYIRANRERMLEDERKNINNAYVSGHFDREIGNFDSDFFDKTFNIEEPDLIQINQNNPVTKGSTTLIKNL
jgi:hypothetical protein